MFRSLTVLCTTVLLALMVSPRIAFAGDTVTVKTLTFQDTTKRSGTWLFPPSQRYEKILMEYTLKCDPATTHDNYNCGEWDYLTYTFITDSSGTIDSTRFQSPWFWAHRSAPPTLTYADVSDAPTLQPDSMHVVASQFAQRNPVQNSHRFAVNPGTQPLTQLQSQRGFRAHFVFTGNELDSAGLERGYFSRMSLQAYAAPFAARGMMVRMRQKIALDVFYDSLSPERPELDVVFRSDSVTIAPGVPQWLDFHQYFNWSLGADVIVDISVDSLMPGSGELMARPGGKGLASVFDDARPGFFDAGDEIELPQSIADGIGDELTIAFWSKEDTLRSPAQSSVFEAWDAQGRRVLNAHVPWEDGNGYFDAGLKSDGSNDRLDFGMGEYSEKQGRWNHWVLTKDSDDGWMRVYLNGRLLKELPSKQTAVTGIKRFVFGSGNAGSFPGSLMHIVILNKVIDLQQVQALMTKGRTGLTVPTANILAYYEGFPGGATRTLTDIGGGNRHARMFGLPTLIHIDAKDRPFGFAPLTMRPSIGFDQDSSITTSAPTTQQYRSVALPLQYTDVVRNTRNVEKRIYPEDSLALLPLPTDTVLVLECDTMVRTFTESAVVRTPRKSAPQILSMRNGRHSYFSRIANFEIGRYITPYGIGLDLGPNGFKWVFDVSDYAQLLHDNVTLSAGNQQELIDLTFKLIKGVPPRDVEQLDQIYSVRDGSYAEMVAGRLLTPEIVNIEPAAVTHRLKTRTTGHRFGAPSNCAEFCQRNHQLFVDGTKRFEWLLWNECASNPVYPQGGTWVIDRAGWCPGAPVDVYDHELTPFSMGKDSILVDYGVQGDEWNGSQGVWDVTTQFVGYGAPNHHLDVAVEEIIAPTTEDFYHRINPICGEPVIVIRNTGAADLTTCTIVYGAEGGEVRTYNWSGRLRFLERDTLVLPAPAWPDASGLQRFEVLAEMPNGGADEYADNDSKSSPFLLPPLWYRDFEIVLRTNNQAAAQYNWFLRKISGDTVASGKNLADNTTYSHKYTLEDGCYEFQLNNVEGYGLDLWFVRQDLGTGYLSFKSLETTIKSFNPDFGNTAWMQFRVANKPTLVTDTDILLFATPGLEKTTRQIRMTPGNNAGVVIDSLSIFSLKKHFTLESTSHTFPATLQMGDTLVATIAYQRDAIGVSLGTLRIHSNDERQLTKTVKLSGEAGATHVDEEDVVNRPDIQLIPNPSDGNATLMIDRAATVRVFDALGALICQFDATEESTQALPMPKLSAGAYSVVAQSGRSRTSITYVVVR